MNTKVIRILGGVFSILAFTFSVTTNVAAQNKVVVIPLFGDDAPTKKYIFVTARSWFGDFGSGEIGDDLCQSEADAIGSLVKGKTFMALITGDMVREFGLGSRRFTPYAVPYVLVNEVVIANNYSDLINGTLDHRINVDQFGRGNIAQGVWTGLDQSGIGIESSSCGGWDFNGATDFGRRGSTDSLDSNWISSLDVACNSNQARLYCIEQ
jgi:hypothetical protein